MNSDKFQVPFFLSFFQVPTFSLSKRFAIFRNDIYVKFSNLNLEMMLVDRIFEFDIFNSDKTAQGSTVQVYFCCFIRF